MWNRFREFSQTSLSLVVDPRLSRRWGEQGLRSISMLQAMGFETFSYFSSWRTRDLRGSPLHHEPGEYNYMSLATRGGLSKLDRSSSLGIFNTQSSEDNDFSIAFVVKRHREGGPPGRLCIVTETEDFRLRTAAGRPLRDESYMRGSRVFSYGELLTEAIAAIRSEMGAGFGFCPSWATLGWALGIMLVQNKRPVTLGELLESLPNAPYLALWRDMTHFTSYGETRPEAKRWSVQEPEKALSRHYGLTLKQSRRLWNRIDLGADNLLNPFVRRKAIQSKFRDRMIAVQAELEAKGSPVRSLARRSILLPEAN